jgi:hypothetical protein
MQEPLEQASSDLSAKALEIFSQVSELGICSPRRRWKKAGVLLKISIGMSGPRGCAVLVLKRLSARGVRLVSQQKRAEYVSLTTVVGNRETVGMRHGDLDVKEYMHLRLQVGCGEKLNQESSLSRKYTMPDAEW